MINKTAPNTLADLLGFNGSQAMKSAEYYETRATLMTEALKCLMQPLGDLSEAQIEAVSDLAEEWSDGLRSARADAEEVKEREATEARMAHAHSSDFLTVMATLTHDLRTHLRMTHAAGHTPDDELAMFPMAKELLDDQLEAQQIHWEAEAEAAYYRENNS